MNHDPLCPQDGVGARFTAFGPVCDDCNLIARVREDERSGGPDQHSCTQDWSDGWNDGANEGYVTALRDAATAIESEWTEDPSWDGTNWNNALSVAINAIDALKEKP